MLHRGRPEDEPRNYPRHSGRARELKLGILFAAGGVAGRSSDRTAAYPVIAQDLAEGRRIVVIASADLASLRRPADIVDLLKDKIVDLVVRQAMLPSIGLIVIFRLVAQSLGELAF